MGKIYEYTLEDCDCRFCLYHDQETEICQLEVCCCLEEKQAALARLGYGVAPRAEECRA